MIQSFVDRDTEAFFRREVCPARWRQIENVAFRKLDMLDAATIVEDLRWPPGNRLEALKADRAGTWSIRINDRWRVCFGWDEGPTDVEIVDYH